MSICRWDDEDTDDNVMGSGADTWEWYRTEIRFDDGKYVVRMADPDDFDKTNTYHFTRGKVRSTMTQMAMGKLPVNDRLTSYAKNDDMDADSMDCLIQFIVYEGEIIYG